MPQKLLQILTSPENQNKLSPERKETLQEIAAFAKTKQQQGKIAKLNFVCTHNARRSLIAEVISLELKEYFRIPTIECYSGGTEVTQVHPNTLTALRKFGFEFSLDSQYSANPRYLVKASKDFSQNIYSKLYDDPPNPSSGYAAVMLCNQADTNCPVVYGAEVRYRLPFADMQVFDSLENALENYEKAILYIARELFYLFQILD